METGTQNQKEQNLDTKKTGCKNSEWLCAFLNVWGIYSRPDGNCRHCNPHLIFDEVKS